MVEASRYFEGNLVALGGDAYEVEMDMRIVGGGVFEKVHDFVRFPDLVHHGRGHLVARFEASGAVALKPDFFFAFDAAQEEEGEEGRDGGEEAHGC